MKGLYTFLCYTILAKGCFSFKGDFIHDLNIQATNGVGTIASRPASKCVCPPSTPSTRVIDEDELWVQKRTLVRKMWERPIPVLTEDQKVMRNAILALANSDSRAMQQIAFVNTAWVWVYLPYASQTPQLCPFAQMINTTVEWQYTKNPQIMIEAVKEMSISLINGGSFLGNNAIVFAECKPLEPKFREISCFENGHVYDIDSIWKNTEVLLPCRYETIAKKLYKSTSYTDRLLAAVATACASEPFLDLPALLDEKLVHDLFGLIIQGPISPCCCEDFTKNVVGSYVPFEIDAPKAVSKIQTKLMSIFAAQDYLPPI